VLLMEAVIDAEGFPAPRLIDATIPAERAAELYADIRQQMVRMLTCDLIHGDLSPYNVLLAWNGPTLIDFPQVVGAAHNRQAEHFFQRDLDTMHRFFAQLDPRLRDHAGDGHEIWRAYQRRELTSDFVPKPGARPGPRHPHFQKHSHQPRQPRKGAPPQNKGPKGPTVSYVGQPESAPQRTGTTPQPHQGRRRRRRRR
jgi:RIO kinase 1